MSGIFLLRLSLDGLAAGLLLVGLAYWWLGNLAHEVAGTAMFLLLITHNVFNRRWYGNVARVRRTPGNVLNVGVTGLLLLAMLTLLATSILISHALAPVLPAWGGFTAKQLHAFAAYWALIIVAIHLGLRWPMLMGIARSLLGLTEPKVARTVLLRLAAFGILVQSIWSAGALGLLSKVSMQMTLDWWNFDEGAAGFFVHCFAVIGGIISATHYGVKLISRVAASDR